MDRLQPLADRWLSIDQNPTTRAEIQSLLAAQDVATLDLLLSTPIAFGTAGLRARMRAGFSQMNDVTVITASQGLASYLLTHTPSPSVVIGHDHRHNSARFARLAAAAFLDKGVKVYFWDKMVHPFSQYTLYPLSIFGL